MAKGFPLHLTGCGWSDCEVQAEFFQVESSKGSLGEGLGHNQTLHRGEKLIIYSMKNSHLTSVSLNRLQTRVVFETATFGLFSTGLEEDIYDN